MAVKIKHNPYGASRQNDKNQRSEQDDRKIPAFPGGPVQMQEVVKMHQNLRHRRKKNARYNERTR
jgi:hypothetical protein